MLEKDDSSIVEADAQVPALSVLLDNDAALVLFQKHLPQLQPTAATCTYLRYKPKVSCLASFVLDTPHGVEMIHAKGYSPAGVVKLANLEQSSERLPPKVRQPVVVRDLRMMFSPFPVDEALPALRLLYDDDRHPTLLKRLAPDFEFRADSRLVALRYKPQRRFVGRIDGAGVPQAIVRVYSEVGYAQSRRAVNSLGQVAAVRTPRILGHSDRHRSLLLQWIEGEPLSKLLAAADCSSEMEAVGAALAALHREQHRKLPRRSPGAEAQSLLRLIADSSFLGAGLAVPMEQLAKRCDKMLRTIPERLASTHGDFHAGQVVLGTSQRVGVIDLDRAALGHASGDLGNFIAHIEQACLYGTLSNEKKWRYSNAFLTGYRQAGGQVEQRSLRIFVAASLLKLIHEPFRYREDGWRDKTRLILMRASNLLNTNEHVQGSHVRTRRVRKKSALREQHAERTGPSLQFADEKIPQLQEALDPQLAADRLTPLVQRCYSNASLELCGVRLLRHKLGRRCVIAYDFRGKNIPEPLTILGKLQAKNRHEQSLQLQQNLWKSGFDDQSLDGISVARPVGMLPSWNLWLQEFVPGQNGWQALAGPNRRTVAARLADAVKKLSDAHVPTTKIHTIHEELRILEEKLPQAARSLPHLEARIEKVLTACRELAATVSSTPRLGIHRDFYPDQLVVAGQRIYVLDHDLYCLGDPCLDIGNFRAHLMEKELRDRTGANAYHSESQAMVDRFVSLAGFAAARVIDVYTTLSLARHIYLSTTFVERRPAADQLLELCERRIASRKR